MATALGCKLEADEDRASKLEIESILYSSSVGFILVLVYTKRPKTESSNITEA